MSGRNQPSRLVWPPSPGWYRLRLVRGGWEVPARLSFDDQTSLWRAEVDGALVADPSLDPAVAGCDRIWYYGRVITEYEFRLLVRLKQILRRSEPGHPALHPYEPIDPNKLRPLSPVRAAES